MTRLLEVLWCFFGVHCLHRIDTAKKSGHTRKRHDGSSWIAWQVPYTCCRCPVRVMRLDVSERDRVPSYQFDTVPGATGYRISVQTPELPKSKRTRKRRKA